MKKLTGFLCGILLGLAPAAWCGPVTAAPELPRSPMVEATAKPGEGAPHAHKGAQEKPYLIGASDLLDVSVWGEQGLSRQVSVRTDGFISLPLIGDIAAVGKTPAQLQKDVETALMKYLKEPHCAIIVVEPRSKRFYVEGLVAHPGFFLLDRDLYLSQAISLAGGFTEWADRGSIVIMRIEDGKQKRIRANYNRIIKGKSPDVQILPGDTIIVP